MKFHRNARLTAHFVLYFAIVMIFLYYPWQNLHLKLILFHLRFDKIIHLIIYSLLSFWLINLLNQCFSKRVYVVLTSTIIIMTSLAFFDEYHQIGKPGRRWEKLDLVFDFIGIFSSALLFLVIRKISHRIQLKKISSSSPERSRNSL